MPFFGILSVLKAFIDTRDIKNRDEKITILDY